MRRLRAVTLFDQMMAVDPRIPGLLMYLVGRRASGVRPTLRGTARDLGMTTRVAIRLLGEISKLRLGEPPTVTAYETHSTLLMELFSELENAFEIVPAEQAAKHQAKHLGIGGSDWQEKNSCESPVDRGTRTHAPDRARHNQTYTSTEIREKSLTTTGVVRMGESERETSKGGLPVEPSGQGVTGQQATAAKAPSSSANASKPGGQAARTPRGAKRTRDQPRASAEEVAAKSPFSKVYEQLHRLPVFKAAGRIEDDDKWMSEYQARYAMSLEELEQVAFELANWASDLKGRKIVSARGTFATFCRNHVERRNREAHRQQNRGRPAPRAKQQWEQDYHAKGGGIDDFMD